MTEISIGYDVVFSKKKSSRPHSQPIPTNREERNSTPPKGSRGFTRRAWFAALGLTALASTLGVVIYEQQRSSTNEYSWFPNTQLDSDVIKTIGEDLMKETLLAGFPEVGQLLVTSQQNPERLQDFYPQAIPPLAVGISDFSKISGLVERYAPIAALSRNMTGTLEYGTYLDKQSNVEAECKFAKPQGAKLLILIDNKLVATSAYLKKLLIVKEGCQVFLAKDQARAIEKQVSSRYDLKPSFPITDMDAFLLMNAKSRQKYPAIPSLGDLFDNAPVDLDGAGYHYIIPPYIEMKQRNLLDTRDLSFTKAIDIVIEDARIAGLLVDNNGKTTWRSDVTPFSTPWISIFRARMAT